MPDAAQRAAIYDRVSVLDKRRSVEQQSAENHEACEEHGLRVVDEYADKMSASRYGKKRRDDWDRLLGDLRAGRFDVLVLWESSRGDRRLGEWISLLDLCRDEGVLIFITSQDRFYDLRKPRDYKALAEEGVDSAYETDKLSGRIQRGVSDAARLGRPHGPCEDGYERIYDPKTRELVEQRPDPARAPVIAEVIARVAAGHAYSAIAKDLNRRGVFTKTGKRWSITAVKTVAGRYTYIGKRLYQGTLYDGQWPALIDEETFYAAQERMRKPGPGKRWARPGKAKYLASGHGRCPCGSELSVRQRTNCQPYYSCHESGHVGIRVDWLDLLVKLAICTRLAQADVMEWVTGGDNAAAVAARKELAAKQGQLVMWRESAARGETSPESLNLIETQLVREIADAEQRARAASLPAVVADLISAGGTGDVKAVERQWDKIHDHGRGIGALRAAIRDLVTITVHPAPKHHHGKRTFDYHRLLERVTIDWTDNHPHPLPSKTSKARKGAKTSKRSRAKAA